MAPTPKRNWLFVVDEEFAEVVCGMSWHRLGKGYLSSRGFTNKVLMHRFVWELAHGKPPERMLDHINGIRWDNRLSNLRLANETLNGLNIHASRGRTGHQGVWHITDRPLAKPWRAAICHRGKQQIIGYFATPEEASAAYQAAKAELIQKEAAKCFTAADTRLA
jgi:hypothetical protein